MIAWSDNYVAMVANIMHTEIMHTEMHTEIMHTEITNIYKCIQIYFF